MVQSRFPIKHQCPIHINLPYLSRSTPCTTRQYSGWGTSKCDMQHIGHIGHIRHILKCISYALNFFHCGILFDYTYNIIFDTNRTVTSALLVLSFFHISGLFYNKIKLQINLLVACHEYNTYTAVHCKMYTCVQWQSLHTFAVLKTINILPLTCCLNSFCNFCQLLTKEYVRDCAGAPPPVRYYFYAP